MQVFDFDTTLQKIIRQILSHLLGERGDERTLVSVHTVLDFRKQIIDLPVNRTHVNLRVDKTGRTDDLFDDSIAQTKFIIARRCRQIYRLADAFLEFRPFERSVIHRRRQTEAMFDQRAFATGIAFVHGADLRHGNMRFVNDE